MAAADYVTVVQQLYVSYFGRPADTSGLASFTAALDTTGVPATIAGVNAAYASNPTVKALVDSFAASAESAALYGSGTAESFVFAIYDHVLNRVPDADGFTFWVNAITNGTLSRGNAALQIMNGALNNTSAQGQADAALVNARIQVATNFTDAITTQNATFSGDAAAAAARTMLDTVTGSTDVSAFQSTIVSTLTAITYPDAGSSFTLTTGADSILGTAKNDTITATSSTLGASDVIIGGDGTDTANITLTAGNAQATISGVENVNFAWDAFGTAAIDATKITGATITGTSAKTGFLGHMTVTAAGANTIVAGSGMVGTLTVNGGTSTTVDAGAAKTVVVNATGTTANDLSATVTAGANTTSVTVGTTNAFKTNTIDAGTATTIAIADQGTTSTTSLTVGKSASVTSTGISGTLTLNVDAANVTTTLSNIGKSLTITGAQATTLKATAAVLTGETVTDSLTAGDLTVAISGAVGANTDLSKVAASKFTIDTAFGGDFAVAVASGAKIDASVDLGNGEFGVLAANDTTTDTLTITSTKAAQTVIQVDGAGATVGAIETLNLVAAAAAVTGTDSTFTSIQAGTNSVILTGTNDVAITDIVAGTLDASGLTGDLSATSTTDAAFTVMGATGTNTMVFAGTTVDSSYTGQNGNDTVTFASTSGNATAVLGNGTNTVTSATTSGSLVVIGGDGVDTVTATSVAGTGTGEVNLSLGGGNDAVTLATNGSADVVTIDAGAGNDNVTFQTNASSANDVYTLAFGDGNDTLTISSVDLSAGTWNVTGLETIAIGSSDTAAKVNAKLLTGQSYEITGDGTATDHLGVVVSSASSVDFSGIVINQTLTKGMAGLSITGSGGNDTIVATNFNDVIDGGTGTNTITGGQGADSMTSNGTDTFVFAAGDSGKTDATVDSITSFATTVDKIKLGLAGSVSNYVEIDANTGATDQLASVASAIAKANAAFDGTVKLAFVFDSVSGVDGWLVYDSNGDKTADMAIKLVGLTAASDFAFGDIIA